MLSELVTSVESRRLLDDVSSFDNIYKRRKKKSLYTLANGDLPMAEAESKFDRLDFQGNALMLDCSFSLPFKCFK